MQECIQTKQVGSRCAVGTNSTAVPVTFLCPMHDAMELSERVCVWVSEWRGFQQQQRIKGLAAGAQKRRRRRNAEPSALLQLYYAVCGVRPGETNSPNEHRDMNFTNSTCLPGRTAAGGRLDFRPLRCVLARTCIRRLARSKNGNFCMQIVRD